MAFEWARKLTEGSFRGVPFNIDSHTRAGGRNVVAHQFPDRNRTRSEDLGKQIPKFSVEFFLLGDDYFELRDRMTEALEQDGAGQLIHPYLGTFQVTVESFEQKESSREGRITRYSVSFLEAGQETFPEPEADNVQATIAAADASIDSSGDVFEEAYSVAAQPQHVTESATANLKTANNFLDKQVKKFSQPTAELSSAINEFNNDAEKLATQPAQIFARTKQNFEILLQNLADTPRTIEKILNEYRTLPDEFEPVFGGSPSQVAQADNQTAIINLTMQIGVANQAKTDVETEYLSSNDAIEARDRAIDNIQTQIFIVLDDQFYQDLRDLQANLVKALPPTDLVDVIAFTPQKSLPALVISYQLFRDLSKEEEIISQNDVFNPNFVPGGDEIEVSVA